METKKKQMKQNNKDKKRRKSMGIILIYVAFSVTGLLLLKIGTTRAFNLSFSNGNFEFSVNSVLLSFIFISIYNFFNCHENDRFKYFLSYFSGTRLCFSLYIKLCCFKGNNCKGAINRNYFYFSGCNFNEFKKINGG